MNLLRKYKLVEKIHTDSRWDIYRGISQADQNSVLIKTIKPQFLGSKATTWLKNEFKILDQLNFSGIIRPHRLEIDQDNVALVLEGFAGQDLAQFLIRASLTLEDFLKIAIQLVDILQELHQHQIIHQNIQPSSIFINPEQLVVKITNFSIALKVNPKENTSCNITPQQLEVLNLAYISPEQTGRINVPLDYRSDFYSLGIVLYQMLTGKLPYDGSNPLELIHCHLAQIPIAPEQLNPDLDETVSRIVMKLLAKNPEDRYQTAEGIKLDLVQCQTQYLNHGAIEPFELGALDQRSQFTISNTLYGRSSAIDAISLSFERVVSGVTEIVLLKGDLGIGKTSLAYEAAQGLIKFQGYFAVGTFEHFNDIPYQGISQAFRGLIQKLLSETESHRQIWQQKILSAIGNNGQVIIEILPELALIIGSQPDIPELPPQETQNRFNTVFAQFVKVFAQPESPLILFFDDLQWADAASLNLIARLQENLDCKYLLVIGAYCDHEIDDSHPLIPIINRIQQTVRVNQITLQPLTLDEVNWLLIDTLHCPERESLSLAQLLMERTDGNPFFVHQLLQTIYREKLLTFNFEELNWQWCIEEILSTTITNYDVLALVCRNINKLPDTSQQILKLAACIGNQFDLEILAHLWHTAQKSIDPSCAKPEPEQITRELAPALKAGIIILAEQQSDSIYKFLHNRVYQTTYSLLNKAEKIETHFRIGQFILQKTPPQKIEEQIFNLVHHLNIAKELLSTSSSNSAHYRLAELNLIAGKKAKAASAYKVAANYLDTALELLPSSTWKDNYDLTLNIYLEAMEGQYLQTNFNRAEEIGNMLLTLVQTLSDEVQVYKIKIHAYIAQNQMQLAISTGLYVLDLLEISIPYNLNHNQDFQSNENLSQDYSVEFLRNLPDMTDSDSLSAMEILTLLIPPIYIVKPQVFPHLIDGMIELCVQSGNCALSGHVYASSGLLLCPKGNIETGYQFGKLALEIQEKYDSQATKSRTDFVFNNMIRHWKEPAISTLEHFLVGIQSGLEFGDIEHACWHATRYCAHLFHVGESLPTAEEKSWKQINFINYLKQDFQLHYARMWHQLNLNLQGLAVNKLLLVGKSFDESQMLPRWQSTNNAMSLFAFYLIKLILCYFFKDYQQAIINAHQGKKYLQGAVGLMCFSAYHFYYSLGMLALCAENSDLKSTYLPEILSCQQQMKQWADYAPDNYLHKYKLITAEIAKVSGEYEPAAEHYDRAIILATEAGYLHETALAEELTGEFYLSKGRTKIAGFYLTDACNKYRRWGALAKTADLNSRYGALLKRNLLLESATTDHDQTATMAANNYESGLNLASLDLFSVIKASQAISSEIILDNLLSKMMEIVIENAGAQKSVLLLIQNSVLTVVASATVSRSKKVILPHIPLVEYQDLPLSIINYIQSSQETVILDHAPEDDRFINDPYIVEHQPKSILGCPMIYQDNLQGIIYLENSLARGAFTPQKLKVLQVLLSQVSISIENAHLYQNLKDHASVQKSLKQKEILLKEIHHRVKNNLLVVSSLLDFQSSYIDDPEMIKLLENCQNRITSMALVHQHLYGNSKLDKVNFAEYIKSLVDNLAYSQGSEERNINLQLDLEPIELNIESANPCGLIVNELVSNAIEHGFCDRPRGNIWLSLKHHTHHQILLTIQDDGVGFGQDMDLHNSDSLGLELVLTLVEQLHGKIELDKTEGTKIEILFSELNYQSRI